MNHIYDAVLFGFRGAHPVVAVDVAPNLLGRFASVRGHHLLQTRIHPQDLTRLDLDVRSSALEPGGGLVDQDAGIRKCRTFAFRATRE